METTSPYATPQTELLNDQETYGPIKILSVNGRIGRLRYIAYTIGITLICYLIMGALSGLAVAITSQETIGLLMIPIIALGVGAMLFINIALTIQRCHDFNVSGWLSLGLLIPLVPFIFWFVPGAVGANRFGPQPPPNRGGAVIIAVILILVVLLGILAAIAIPAYQDYLARATAARM
ncbi:MAG: DUF805 domain-containing protein [Candidatus Thiodiazotropha sp. (ex Dulcina madagascariensis)]|nr:DUF805 domain-containing protein [Candidatus Thiodiazotropha sp. (ex Dulcina madagascariensis)]